MIRLEIWFVCLLMGKVLAEYNRIEEGMPLGLYSDCPGSTKDAKILERSLKDLKIAVLGYGNFLTATKTLYTYHQMKELAANTDFVQKIFIYMPGYMDNVSLFSSAMMGTAYKSLGYNVWILEYSKFSTMFYPRAVRFLPAIGVRIAEMLATLTKYGLNPKNLKLGGISHGGQGISFIAKHYRRLTGTNLTHLIGMDPSGPCFRHLGPNERLDASDADFVEVIHSNIDGYGMAGRMGHIDFYINGGEFQAGDIPQIPCSSLCSHVKTFIYWIAALKNPKLFIGMQCDSIQDARDNNCYDRKPFVLNYLGEKVNKSRHGIFFIPTNYYYPYGMGKKGLIRANNIYIKDLGDLNADPMLVI